MLRKNEYELLVGLFTWVKRSVHFNAQKLDSPSAVLGVKRVLSFNHGVCTYIRKQGSQMVCFRTKNPTLGKFWRVLQRKILAYFMNIWSILRHYKYFMAIWYILWLFGIFSPVLVSCTKKNLATLSESINASTYRHGINVSPSEEKLNRYIQKGRLPNYLLQKWRHHYPILT
jgi:hypothetical protein